MSKNRPMYVHEIEKFLRVADIDCIAIYRDGSGSLTDSTGNKLASFDDTHTMFDALAEFIPTSMSSEQRIITQLHMESKQ